MRLTKCRKGRILLKTNVLLLIVLTSFIIACIGGGQAGNPIGSQFTQTVSSGSTTGTTSGTGTTTSTGGTTTVQNPGPPHYAGYSCVACHTTWNIVDLHNSSSPNYNNNCMLCHGNMSSETSLGAVLGIHPLMMPYVYSAAGQSSLTNAVCTYCHTTVDYLGRSSANLRKHVAAALCYTCHSPTGPGKVLYK